MTKKGRPAAHGVLLEGTYTKPTLVEQFELTSTKDDLATQLLDLASGLRSRLSGLGPDRVVIRRADVAPAGSKYEGPKLRLLAEGALAAAAREKVQTVVLQTGKDLAVRAGASSKTVLDDHAASAVADAPVEAAAAAAAGLV